MGWHCKRCGCTTYHWTHTYGANTDWRQFFDYKFFDFGGTTHGYVVGIGYVEATSSKLNVFFDLKRKKFFSVIGLSIRMNFLPFLCCITKHYLPWPIPLLLNKSWYFFKNKFSKQFYIFQCNIDLQANVLHIGTTNTTTPFLPENELPECSRLTGSAEDDAKQINDTAKQLEDREIKEAIEKSKREQGDSLMLDRNVRKIILIR